MQTTCTLNNKYQLKQKTTYFALWWKWHWSS